MNAVNHRKFHLGDILSITTGKLVSPELMDGVFEILGFMTGDNLYLHAIPRAMDVCKPSLLQQFPQLAFVDARGCNHGTSDQWLADQVNRYGEYFEVENIASFDVKHPIQELIDMGVSEDKTIAVGLVHDSVVVEVDES